MFYQQIHWQTNTNATQAKDITIIADEHWPPQMQLSTAFMERAEINHFDQLELIPIADESGIQTHLELRKSNGGYIVQPAGKAGKVELPTDFLSPYWQGFIFFEMQLETDGSFKGELFDY
ncbi:hypothetical protein [Oleidesulfovibrio alaskensis]